MSYVSVIKLKVYSIYTSVLSFFNAAINTVYYKKYKNPVVIKAWVKVKFGKVVSNNWGDDANVFFIEKITGRKVIIYNQCLPSLLHIKSNYLCIGSVLGDYEDSQSEIWGSGFISNLDEMDIKPRVIHLVRGKLSRQKILNKGIPCPKKYGDPILLLSRYYVPKKENIRYHMGIIPNHLEKDNPIIKDFVQKKFDCKLIMMDNYKNWTDVIDEICSCEYIVSSSLHGLIIADSYGIPNTWIFLSDKIIGGVFKYLDYFSSVQRKEQAPVYIRNENDLNNLYINAYNVLNQAFVDYDSIIESCPFELIECN